MPLGWAGELIAWECRPRRGGGEWSQAESSLHINCLELLAGAFAVKTFTKGKAKMIVCLVTAHYINKMGVPNHQSLLDLHSTFGIGAHNTGSLSRPNIYQELKKFLRTVQSNVGLSRLKARPQSVFNSKSVMEPTRRRCFCFPVDNSASKILQLETRSIGGVLRCICPGLEQGEGICLPSICSTWLMPQETIRSRPDSRVRHI